MGTTTIKTIKSKYSTYTLLEDSTGNYIKYRIYSSLSNTYLYVGTKLNRALNQLYIMSN